MYSSEYSMIRLKDKNLNYMPLEIVVDNFSVEDVIKENL